MRMTVGSALLGSVIATGACFAYRAVALAPTPGSRVRVVLATAMSVTTFAVGRENTRRSYPGVLEASGTIQAAAGDTVALLLGELRTVAGAVPNLSDQIALLPTAQIAGIEERRFQAGTTILVWVGASVLALATFVIVVTVALTRGI